MSASRPLADGRPRQRTVRAPVAVRVGYHAYRLLLPAMPASVRRRHGADMLELFSDLAADAHATGGARAVSLYALRAMGRLLAAGIAERSRARRVPTGFSPGVSTPAPDGGSPLRGIAHDLRHGLRALRRSPGYVALVVVTLGLAIGTNTTIFSMVQMILAPPLPYTNPETLVFPFARNPELNRARAGMSLPDLEDLESVASLRQVAGQRRVRLTLSGNERPVRVAGVDASAGYFRTVGIEPILGRLFLPEETRAGGDRVVLLGYGCWQRRFGGDPGILGRQLTVDGAEHTVVGVLPESLDFGAMRDVEIYRPLARPLDGGDRGRRDIAAVARLAPGASLEQVRAEAEQLSRRLQGLYPESNGAWEITVLGFREALVGPNATLVFSVMSLAVAFVLMIACVNVANLTMARASRRRRELSLRVALGARRWRLVREQLVESALLAVLAGGVGLLLTRWIFSLLVWIGSDQVSFFKELRIDGRVLLFTLCLSLLTPVLFGLWPALRVSGRSLSTALRDGGRSGGSRGERRARRLLVAGQVALAVSLLLVAGLLSRSMHALLTLDLGFDADNLLSFRIERPDTELPAAADARQFFDALRGELATIPGVRAVGLSSHRPILGGEPIEGLFVEGREEDSRRDGSAAATVVVDPGFLEVVGIPLQRGRNFEERDDATAATVAIVSRAAVERYWPDSDPLRSRIRVGGPDAPWRQVVGVVADLRNPDADLPPEPHVYLPFAQRPATAMAVLMRTETAPLGVVDAVRDRVWRIDPRQPLDDVRTMARIRYDDFAGDLGVISLVALFALVAFALAVAGVYGVVSQAVSQRHREIGIRMAVGASSGDVLGLILRQGLAPVLAGIALGLLLGFAFARLIAGTLYGVGATDPIVFLGVPAALAAVGLVASLLPARRAAGMDPAWTLRSD